MKKNILIVALSFCLIISVFLAPANAQITPPFGGRKIVLIPCTAMSPYFLEYYIPADFDEPFALMEPPTIPYDYYVYLIPGANMLGDAAPVAIPCLVYAGVTVVSIGTGNPVIQEGNAIVMFFERVLALFAPPRA